ncbi:MAG: hypothetical protein ACKOF9_11790 [Burkholderiales bacterium]
MQSSYFLSVRCVTAALLACGALLSGCATAQQHTEYGTVVSSTPVLAPLNVPQQQCVDQPQSVAPRGSISGGGAVAGAVIGGLIGSTMGGGSHGIGTARHGTARHGTARHGIGVTSNIYAFSCMKHGHFVSISH